MEVRNRHSQFQQTRTDQESKDHTNLSQQVKKNTFFRKLLRFSLFTVSILLLLYSTVIFTVWYSTWVQHALIFVHHIRSPFFSNFSDPASFGLNGTVEFELFHEDGCEIEVWHVLPISYHEKVSVPSKLNLQMEFLNSLSDDAPIVLYLHGNTGSRALQHRVGLYKYLAEEKGYHVIAFDYRGFANSECYPSEKGMMEDSLLVWNWLKENAQNSKVYIWGHSLGSAAATYLTKELCDIGSPPDGLILDAPFTDITEAACHHPFSIPFWPIMPLFKYFVLESFNEKFESVKRIKHITCSMLIFHGQNDFIIPFHIGKKFHNMAVQYKKEHPHMGNIKFVDCGDTTHKTNFLSSSAQEALEKFITKS